MKIILNPHEGSTRADLISMACTAHFALATGIEDQPVGFIMCVSRGDHRETYGVVRRKGSISVYPPALAEAGRTKEG